MRNMVLTQWSYSTSPKISVLYVTNRMGGMDILLNGLKKQTFRNWELVIVDDVKGRAKEVQDYFKEIPLIYLEAPKKKKGYAWNLNAAYNLGFKNCSGELIVSLQDYIWIPGNGLEKFWDLYQVYGWKNLFCGVGNKAKYPDKLFELDEKVSTFKGFPIFPYGISERDTRIDSKRDVIEDNYSQWELNWAAIPRKLVEELGGFDEDMDTHYGCDNSHFAARAGCLEAKILIDRGNECVGYNQCLFPRPKDWEEKHANKGFINKKLEALNKGLEPICLKNTNPK